MAGNSPPDGCSLRSGGAGRSDPGGRIAARSTAVAWVAAWATALLPALAASLVMALVVVLVSLTFRVPKLSSAEDGNAPAGGANAPANPGPAAGTGAGTTPGTAAGTGAGTPQNGGAAADGANRAPAAPTFPLEPVRQLLSNIEQMMLTGDSHLVRELVWEGLPAEERTRWQTAMRREFRQISYNPYQTSIYDWRYIPLDAPRESAAIPANLPAGSKLWAVRVDIDYRYRSKSRPPPDAATDGGNEQDEEATVCFYLLQSGGTVRIVGSDPDYFMQFGQMLPRGVIGSWAVGLIGVFLVLVFWVMMASHCWAARPKLRRWRWVTALVPLFGAAAYFFWVYWRRPRRPLISWTAFRELWNGESSRVVEIPYPLPVPAGGTVPAPAAPATPATPATPERPAGAQAAANGQAGSQPGKSKSEGTEAASAATPPAAANQAATSRQPAARVQPIARAQPPGPVQPDAHAQPGGPVQLNTPAQPVAPVQPAAPNAPPASSAAAAVTPDAAPTLKAAPTPDAAGRSGAAPAAGNSETTAPAPNAESVRREPGRRDPPA
ncbi:MAG: hypothetical protein ACREJ2_08075 [Planctomycetota bacterium]